MKKKSNSLLLLNPYSKTITLGEIICNSRDTKNLVLKKPIPGKKKKGNSTSKKPRKQQSWLNHRLTLRFKLKSFVFTNKTENQAVTGEEIIQLG